VIYVKFSSTKNKQIRLLSCNDLDAAIEVSKNAKSSFYASDGWVDKNGAGEVASQEKFYKFANGKRTEESLAHVTEVKGKVVVLGELASVGSKIKLLTKLNNLVDAKAFVNSLDEVADASLLNKIDNLNQTQLENLNAFYKNHQSPSVQQIIILLLQKQLMDYQFR